MRPGKLAETLCISLENEILSGQLAPGERLDEGALAKRFDMSRTPVREALQMLLAEGLAHRQEGSRGVFVTRMTEAGLVESFEALAEIEAVCARLAALRMNPASRRQLESLHQMAQDCLKRDDHDRYETLNRKFHALIYTSAQNQTLVDAAASVRRSIAPYRRVQFQDPHRMQASHLEHDQIIQAVVRADAQAASQHMFDHMMSALDQALAGLRSLHDGMDDSDRDDALGIAEQT